MIIDSDRTQFNELLAEPSNSFLLLFGADVQLAIDIHNVASDPNVVEDWNKAVLFRDLSVLSDDEKSAWFAGNDKGTTLSKQKTALPAQFPTPHSRKVVEQEPLTAHCVQGLPSPRKIQAAFGRGDAA